MGAVAVQHIAPETTEALYPIPGKERTSPPALTPKAVALSAALHVVVLFAVVVGSWSTTEPVTATPQTFDVSLVPLSALETLIPRGEANAKPAETPAPAEAPKPPVEQKRVETKPAAKVQPKKKVISPAKDPARVVSAPPSESSPSAAPAASAGGTIGSPDSTSTEPARVNYQDMVATLLAKAKRYPERALRRQMTGDATIRIQIASSGAVTRFEIVQSTSSPILDEELKEMVDRASPFPPFPGDLKRDSLALVVPVSFRLR